MPAIQQVPAKMDFLSIHEATELARARNARQLKSWWCREGFSIWQMSRSVQLVRRSDVEEFIRRCERVPT